MILKKKEYAMLTVFIASIIISSIIFKNYWLSTLNGILGLLSIFLQAKGLIIGQFVGIADSLCYGIFALQYNYIGEFAVYIFILIPIYIYGIFNWNKNKINKHTTPKNFTKRNYICLFIISFIILQAIFVSLYFLKSKQIILNTLSVYSLICANFLLAIRSFIGFVFYIINDIVLLSLWIIPIIEGDLKLLSFFVCIFIYLVCDIYGIYTWENFKKY